MFLRIWFYLLFILAIIGFIFISFICLSSILGEYNIIIHYDKSSLPKVDILKGPIIDSPASINKRKLELEKNSKSINSEVDRIYKECRIHR